MTAIGAQEMTTTRNCKIEGCDQEAESERGRYALLCHRHKFDARMAGSRSRVTVVHSTGDAPPSYEAIAKGLVSAGRSVDQARAVVIKRRAKAATSIKAATHQLDQALSEWKRLVQELAR